MADHEQSEAARLYAEMFTKNVAVKLLIDPETGRIVDANPSARRFYGYSLEELQQLRIHDINTLPEPAVHEEMARARAEQRRYFRFRHRVRSGEERDVEVFSGPLELAGQRYLYSIIHDITDIRAYQRELEVYRDLFRSLPVGVYRNTPGPVGCFLEVNPAMVELFEARHEAELLATPVAELYVDPEQRSQISARLEQEEWIAGVELQLRTLRGRPLWVRLSVRRSRDEAGHTVFDGMLEDITDRVRLQGERDHLLEAINEGVCGIDRDGRFTFVNPTACYLFGWPDERQLLGCNAHELTHHSRADGRPFPEVDCPIYRVLATGEPLEAWEDHFWRRDGSHFPVLVYAAPLREEGGQIYGVVISFQDISERKRAERERDQMLEILDYHPHLIQRFLPDTTLLYANRSVAELFGVAEASMPGQRWGAWLDPGQQVTLEAFLAGLTAGEPVGTLQLPVIVDECEEPRWVQWTVQAFFDREGGLTHFQSVGIDITDRVAAERAREQADRDRHTFLAAVSHDLRTPLNAIHGFTDLLETTSLDAQQRHYVQLCRDGSEKLVALIDSLLDLSRLESGRLCLRQEPFELRETVERQVALLRAVAEEAGLSLTVDIDPAIPTWVVGDATRFGQVLHNLTSNAIQFTEHGSITLTVASVGCGRVRTAVTDTGVGVAPEERERIFEAFTQGTPGFRRYPGSGLGLRICRELVRLMGGELELDSELGVGSTFAFTVELPRAMPPERGAAAGERAGQTQHGSGLRVLVAEDDPTNGLLIRAQLELAGAEPVVVEDGRQAVEFWQEQGADLVLMDVQMPVLNGPDAVSAIRRLEAQAGSPRTPVVALTAHAVDHIREACMSAGCDAYMTKPLSRELLAELLARVRDGGYGA
ncbi:MAG: PAS domain S-box protein [Halorhodospira sp.]